MSLLALLPSIPWTTFLTSSSVTDTEAVQTETPAPPAHVVNENRATKDQNKEPSSATIENLSSPDPASTTARTSEVVGSLGSRQASADPGEGSSSPIIPQENGTSESPTVVTGEPAPTGPSSKTVPDGNPPAEPSAVPAGEPTPTIRDDDSTSSLDSDDIDKDANTAVDDRTYNGRRHGSRKRTCDCSDKTRNLVVCIDGTSNEFGEKNTNVIELYSLIPKGEADNQRTYYNSGIGTYAGPSRRSLSKVLGTKLDLAIAWNFETIVLDAYRWLSETYHDGDRIFLFGFSRGAYQVRVLSAMIHKVGLIDRGNEKQIPFAYKWYTNTDNSEEEKEHSFAARVAKEAPASLEKPSAPTSSDPRSRIHTAKRFKEVFSRNVQVHFVGAWDTVSSVGIMRGRKLLPGTADGMEHVCYFRHALALDERRVKFLPEYACGAMGPVQPRSDLQKRFSDTKEVWFAGTHSDVGGGNVKNENLDSARPALRWMYAEASVAGLYFDLFKRKTKVSDDGNIKVNESLSGAWWLLEYLPLRRLKYTTKGDKVGKETTRRFHCGNARVIQKGQKIHPSVWLSENLLTKYLPRARVHDSTSDEKVLEVEFWLRMEFWRTMKGRQDIEADGTALNPWKEVDIYEVTAHLVQQYTATKYGRQEDNRQKTLLTAMRTHAGSVEGWLALSREVTQLLEEDKLVHLSSLCDILEVLIKTSSTPVSSVGSYRILRSQMLSHFQDATEHENKIARDFLTRFSDFQQVLYGHTGVIRDLAFSSDGKRIVSGSYDHTIRIWDAKSGQMLGKPLEGHTDAIETVAFSPDDKRIISGADDTTIRIWDVDSGLMEGKPLEGHRDPVISVAFTSDGKRIMSGANDKKVRIWDAETGHLAESPYKAPKGPLRCIAFSPNGRRLAGGYEDTVRIRDAETGKTVLAGAPVKGHNASVHVVAFSYDGKRVVSGSSDKTVRLWDAETGLTIGDPFVGHDDSVCMTRTGRAQQHDRSVNKGGVDTSIRKGRAGAHDRGPVDNETREEQQVLEEEGLES
ncbi:unnamed protein product [Peniophora sp. CBMAI 1063]|nr:unnamed protein product [Peniophora sp. CBMAI 1063]